MARLTRDVRLETREARSKLKKRRPPYWRSIHQGLAIGYRKGEKGGVWMIRKLVGDDKYSFETIGATDDNQDANGIDVLSYAEAHRKALELSNKTTREEHGPYTVKQAADDYIEWASANTKTVAAITKDGKTEYRGTTVNTVRAHILPEFGERTIDSLTSKELDSWKSKLVTSPIRRRGKKGKPTLVEVAEDPEAIRKRRSSANRILTVFKAILNRAFEHKKAKDDAEWRRVKPYKKADAARKIVLQPDQIERLINSAQVPFRDYVRTLLYTGCRPGKELEFVRVRDFDARHKTLHIPDGKTGPRDVYLTDEGVMFFKRLTTGRGPDDFLLVKSDGTQWGKSHHDKPMKAAAKAAKLPKGTNCYSLRHTFISMAIEGGANLKVIVDSCGTSIRMLEKNYAKEINKGRRDSLNSALPSFGLKDDGKVRAIR